MSDGSVHELDKYVVVRDERHLFDVWDLLIGDNVQLSATWRGLDDEAELLLPE